MKTAIQQNAKVLAMFAVACTAIVGIVNYLTKDTIARQEEQQLLDTLHQVIAPERLNNDLYQDCQFITDNDLLGSNNPQTAYVARMDNIPVAVAITSIAPDGYNGNINLLVAINIDGTLSGVRVLKHKETPGLGDKIETRKADWVYSFDGKFIDGEKDLRWAVKKDGGMFDQFTGATITPRAVVKAVQNTLFYFNAHKNNIVNNTISCRELNND